MNTPQQGLMAIWFSTYLAHADLAIQEAQEEGDEGKLRYYQGQRDAYQTIYRAMTGDTN
jgi:hypothetical protein